MIVVDASALVAVGEAEPGFERYVRAIVEAPQAMIGQVNYLEVGMVLIRRRVLADPTELDRWLGNLGVEIDESGDLGADALAAYLRYGKGVHPARLNLADCFAYALARKLDAPLLYKGDDFALTDVRPALQPT
ncbi:MAG: type II toxin-antitoxin system VapC family toxin [Phenylobacterium sp.]|uniref:type II toxin-antitoxin system VapC family toxin n=1 Tax=Phenylobacterium sp. TaxID=1871053 RepID=UPI00391A0321